MKVAALFTDYDGTIAPMGVPRRESNVPEALRSRLVRLSSRIPVAVITSKDLAFIRPRTTFARGWACAMGMEISLADGRRHIMDCAPEASVPLGMAENLVPNGAILEKKMASDGRALGLSIDWTGAPRVSRREVDSLVSALKDNGLYVRQEEGETFVDAFCANTDKGVALVSLKKMLGVEGAVMYLGDSVHDNDAFDLAEFPVGVSHGQRTKELRCRCLVEYGQVATLLDHLLEQDLDFVYPPEVPARGKSR
ncbi:MAG: hypothetical protein JRN09_00435 [Nitrososphaerota archaeon]|nr:hypothetical protein [Nitrososphaerota archaeon]